MPLPWDPPSGSFAARQSREYLEVLASLLERYRLVPRFNTTNTPLLAEGRPVCNLVGASAGRERIWLNRTSAATLATLPAQLRIWLSADTHSENDPDRGAIAFWYTEGRALRRGWEDAFQETVTALGLSIVPGTSSPAVLKAAWHVSSNRSGPEPGATSSANEAWMVEPLVDFFRQEGKKSSTTHVFATRDGPRHPDLFVPAHDHAIEIEPTLARARGKNKTSGLAQVRQWPCRRVSVAVPMELANGPAWDALVAECREAGCGLFGVERAGSVEQVLAPRSRR